MTSKLFIDSDVVIDFFTDREPFANPASEIFELNEQRKVELHVSAVSINNIYYIGLPQKVRFIHNTNKLCW